MIKFFLIISILSLSFIELASAQQYDKVEGAWKALFLDIPLSNKFVLRSEFHSRTIDYFNIWDQQIFRPQITFSDSTKIKWTIGYSYLRNFDADINADPRVRNEHNIWEQISYKVPLKKGSFSTWFRLEHRFQEELPLKKNLSEKSFGLSSRIRVRFTYERPISKANSKLPVNFVFYDEIFTVLNRSGIPYKFNQNWTFLGFKFKVNDKAIINTGFQKNTILKSTDLYLKNRFWNTILFYKI